MFHQIILIVCFFGGVFWKGGCFDHVGRGEKNPNKKKTQKRGKNPKLDMFQQCKCEIFVSLMVNARNTSGCGLSGLQE